jgi:FKBP-type peptidyl-prolyl cis-trans isomerase 2
VDELGEMTEYGDWVVLDFRLSSQSGEEIDSTFGEEPITLRLGDGVLEPKLEQCLVGISPRHRYVFSLEPEEAFGVSDPGRILDIPLESFPGAVPAEPDSLIAFDLPEGGSAAGVVVDKTPTHARVDFNHPLSDCPVVFEVEIREIVRE